MVKKFLSIGVVLVALVLPSVVKADVYGFPPHPATGGTTLYHYYVPVTGTYVFTVTNLGRRFYINNQQLSNPGTYTYTLTAGNQVEIRAEGFSGVDGTVTVTPPAGSGGGSGGGDATEANQQDILDELSDVQTDLDNLDANDDQILSDISDLQDSVDNLPEPGDATRTNQDQIIADLADLSDKLDDLDTNDTGLQDAINSLQNTVDGVDNNVDQLLSDLSEVRTAVDNADTIGQEQRNDILAQIDSVGASINLQLGDLDAGQTSLLELLTDLNNKVDQIDTDSLSTLDDQIATLQETIDKNELSRQVDTLNTSSGPSGGSGNSTSGGSGFDLGSSGTLGGSSSNSASAYASLCDDMPTPSGMVNSGPKEVYKVHIREVE